MATHDVYYQQKEQAVYYRKLWWAHDKLVLPENCAMTMFKVMDTVPNIHKTDVKITSVKIPLLSMGQQSNSHQIFVN